MFLKILDAGPGVQDGDKHLDVTQSELSFLVVGSEQRQNPLLSICAPRAMEQRPISVNN
jgi:hypothetical protein